MVNRTSRPGRRALQQLLREIRTEAGLTQAELAAKLRRTQGYVNKYEAGDLGLEILDLRDILGALDVSLPEFALELEKRLQQMGTFASARNKGKAK